MFFRVTVCGLLLVPMACGGKVRLVGENVTGNMLVLCMLNTSGLNRELLAMVTLPTIVPGTVGLNVTAIWHEAPALNGPPQG